MELVGILSKVVKENVNIKKILLAIKDFEEYLDGKIDEKFKAKHRPRLFHFVIKRFTLPKRRHLEKNRPYPFHVLWHFIMQFLSCLAARC